MRLLRSWRDARLGFLVALVVMALTLLVGVLRGIASEPLPETPHVTDESGIAQPILPDPSTLPDPIDYGPYRIYPWGAPASDDQSGQVPQTEQPPEAFGTLAEASELLGFWLPAYIPESYQLTQIWGVSREGVILGQSLTYESGGNRFEVVSRQPNVLPIRIDWPQEATPLTLETGSIGAAPAILLRPKEGFAIAGPSTVRFVRGGEEFVVRGVGVPWEELLRIAESIP